LPKKHSAWRWASWDQPTERLALHPAAFGGTTVAREFNSVAKYNDLNRPDCLTEKTEFDRPLDAAPEIQHALAVLARSGFKMQGITLPLA
jgi:hypothetical protein